MYLADREIEWAIRKGHLIVDPYVPARKFDGIGTSSIDVHLGPVEEAKIWNVSAITEHSSPVGGEPAIYLGDFNYGKLSGSYLCAPPKYVPGSKEDLVSLRGDEVIVRPNGFLLWQTLERLGTPEKDPRYICFIDGKSTRARTGIVIHLTAPTIHAGWSGKVVLEIKNLGPLTFVLRPNDVVAQLTVATVSSCPEQTQLESGSITHGQVDATGSPQAAH